MYRQSFNLILKKNLMTAAAVVFATVALISCAYAAIPDFTFIHVSDEHTNSGPTTAATIADLSALSSVTLEPYGVNAITPSFVIETGDMTEFGPKNGAWDLLNTWYSSCKLTRYRALGNHDSTWRSLSPEMTKLYGASYYSFDKFGCHFVILDSAGLQDPRPVLSPEELDWLKKDLARVGRECPVFVAMHHPLDCQEFSGIYEVDRLVDILHPYNIALVLVGHGHNVRHSNYDGIDMVEGGSAFGPGKPGYQVISVLNGKLRVAFKEQGSPVAAHAMVEKPLAPSAARYPSISIQSPVERASFTDCMPVKAWVDIKAGEVKDAYVEIDSDQKVNLTRQPKGSFETEIDVSKLSPGAHYIRVCFAGQDGVTYHRSTSFYTDSARPRALWRAYMGAASKSRPTAAGNTVYVGTNDGSLRAYDIKTGKLNWRFRTGGAVTSEPLVVGGNVYFGSEDTSLYCVSASTGKLIWKFIAGSPIYSSPVSDGTHVYFGAADGAFYSVSVSQGKLAWKNTDATYNIEVKPFLAEGRIYYGCWDAYLYCLNTSDGSLVWKCVGKGSSEGTAPAYYSPADCGPVVCKGKVYVADRKYRLSVIDASTGSLTSYKDAVSAVGLAIGSSDVFLRKTDGALVKVDDAGKEVWTASVSMDHLPAAPSEAGGIVYVCSRSGLVSAVSSTDGKVLWQYRVSPQSFVLSGIGTSSNCVFVAGTDGVLTALKI
ncbi:MAG: PQQ-binding-like beta-propeller repeat protein [Armatimonadota bacterium]|nr:PQQ-binding-like beta-propeller repeat protein [bacterium]